MISREADKLFHSLLIPSTPAGWQILFLFQTWMEQQHQQQRLLHTSKSIQNGRMWSVRTHLCPRDSWSPPCGLGPFGPAPSVSPPSSPSPSGPSSSRPELSSPRLLWPVETFSTSVCILNMNKKGAHQREVATLWTFHTITKKRGAPFCQRCRAPRPAWQSFH